MGNSVWGMVKRVLLCGEWFKGDPCVGNGLKKIHVWGMV